MPSESTGYFNKLWIRIKSFQLKHFIRKGGLKQVLKLMHIKHSFQQIFIAIIDQLIIKRSLSHGPAQLIAFMGFYIIILIALKQPLCCRAFCSTIFCQLPSWLKRLPEMNSTTENAPNDLHRKSLKTLCCHLCSPWNLYFGITGQNING